MPPIMPSAGTAPDDRALRVAFDVTAEITGRTGIARYVTQLDAALGRDGVELRRFAIGRGSFPLPPGARHLKIPARLLIPWWRIVPWPTAELLAGGADLTHATGAGLPATRLPLVVTVHDIAALRHPELHPARHVQQQRALIKALRRTAVILTVSAATADDLVHAGIPGERIVVTLVGRTPLPEPTVPANAPDPGYLLTVGETSPRKGYPLLLRALARLDASPPLMMVGPPAGDEERVRELIAQLGLEHRVTRVGAVSESELSWFYENGLALCFPSIAEGFGSPLVEALGAGLPIIASDIPPTREVAGDVPIYPAAGDDRSWADAIDALVSDPTLHRRKASEARGRAPMFAWERTAADTLAAYRMALAGAG